MTEYLDTSSSSSFWHAKAAIAKTFANRRPPVDVDTRDSLCKCARGLYLSSCHLEAQKNVLQQYGVTHVLQVGKELSPSHPSVFSYKTVSVYDLEEEDLIKHFPECFSFINAGRDTGAVLVHCAAGISRSATVVIGYLMATGGLSLEDARAAVKAVRPVINPNQGFLLQLQLFQDAGCSAEGWQPWNLERFLQVRAAAYPCTDTSASSVSMLGACATAPPELSREDSISPFASPGQSPVRPTAPIAAAVAAKAVRAALPAAGSGSGCGASERGGASLEVPGGAGGRGAEGLVSRSRRWLSEAAISAMAATTDGGIPGAADEVSAIAIGQALPRLPGMGAGAAGAGSGGAGTCVEAPSSSSHAGSAAALVGPVRLLPPPPLTLPPQPPQQWEAITFSSSAGQHRDTWRALFPGRSSSEQHSSTSSTPLISPHSPATNAVVAEGGAGNLGARLLAVPAQPSGPTGSASATPHVIHQISAAAAPAPGVVVGAAAAPGDSLGTAAAWARSQALAQQTQLAPAQPGFTSNMIRRPGPAVPWTTSATAAAAAGNGGSGADAANLQSFPIGRQSSPMLHLGHEVGSGSRVWGSANGMGAAAPAPPLAWRTAFTSGSAAAAAVASGSGTGAHARQHAPVLNGVQTALGQAVTPGSSGGPGTGHGVRSFRVPSAEGAWGIPLAAPAVGSHHPAFATYGRPPPTSLSGAEVVPVAGAAGTDLAPLGADVAASGGGGSGEHLAAILPGARRHGLLRRSLSDGLPSLLTRELSATLHSPGGSGASDVGSGGGVVASAGCQDGARDAAGGAVRPLGAMEAAAPRFIPSVSPIAHSPRISTDSGGSHGSAPTGPARTTADGAAEAGAEAPGADAFSDCAASSTHGPSDTSSSTTTSTAGASAGGSGASGSEGGDATPCSGRPSASGKDPDAAATPGRLHGLSPVLPRRGPLPWALQPVLTPAGLERTPSKVPQTPAARAAAEDAGEGGPGFAASPSRFGPEGMRGLLPASPIGPAAAAHKRSQPRGRDGGGRGTPGTVPAGVATGTPSGSGPPALLSQLLVALALSHSTAAGEGPGLSPYVRADADLACSRTNSLGGAAPAGPASEVAAGPAMRDGGEVTASLPCQLNAEAHEPAASLHQSQENGCVHSRPAAGRSGPSSHAAHMGTGRTASVRSSRLATATFAGNPAGDSAMGGGGLVTVGDGDSMAVGGTSRVALGGGGSGSAGGDDAVLPGMIGARHSEDTSQPGRPGILLERCSAPSAVSTAQLDKADSVAAAAGSAAGPGSTDAAPASHGLLALPGLRLRPFARSRNAALESSTEGLPTTADGGAGGCGSGVGTSGGVGGSAGSAAGGGLVEGGASTPIHKRVLRSLTWLLSKTPESPTARQEAPPAAPLELVPGPEPLQQPSGVPAAPAGEGFAAASGTAAGGTLPSEGNAGTRPPRRRLWGSGAEEGIHSHDAAGATAGVYGTAMAAAAVQVAAALAAATPTGADWGLPGLAAGVRETVSLPPAPSALSQGGWNRRQPPLQPHSDASVSELLPGLTPTLTSGSQNDEARPEAGSPGGSAGPRMLSRSRSCSPTISPVAAAAAAAAAMGGSVQVPWARSPAGSSGSGMAPWDRPFAGSETSTLGQNPSHNAPAQEATEGLQDGLDEDGTDSIAVQLRLQPFAKSVVPLSPGGSNNHAMGASEKHAGWAPGSGPRAFSGHASGSHLGVCSGGLAAAPAADAGTVVMASEVDIGVDLLPAEPFRWDGETDPGRPSPPTLAGAAEGNSCVGSGQRTSGASGVVGEPSQQPLQQPQPTASEHRVASGPRRAGSRHFSLDGSAAGTFLPASANPDPTRSQLASRGAEAGATGTSSSYIASLATAASAVLLSEPSGLWQGCSESAALSSSAVTLPAAARAGLGIPALPSAAATMPTAASATAPADPGARHWSATLSFATPPASALATAAAAAEPPSRRPRSSYSGAFSMMPPTHIGIGGIGAPVITHHNDTGTGVSPGIGGGGASYHKPTGHQQLNQSPEPAGQRHVRPALVGSGYAGEGHATAAAAGGTASIAINPHVPGGPVSPLPSAPPSLHGGGVAVAGTLPPEVHALSSPPSQSPLVTAVTSPHAGPSTAAPAASSGSGGGFGGVEHGAWALPQQSASVQLPPAWGGSRSSAALFTMPSEPSDLEQEKQPLAGSTDTSAASAIDGTPLSPRGSAYAAGQAEHVPIGPGAGPGPESVTAQTGSLPAPGSRVAARSTSTGSSAAAHAAAAGGMGTWAPTVWEHSRGSRRQLQYPAHAASAGADPLGGRPAGQPSLSPVAAVGAAQPPTPAVVAPATAPPTAAASPVAYGTRRSGGGVSGFSGGSASAGVSPSSAAAAVAAALAVAERVSGGGSSVSGGVQSPRTPPSMSLDLFDLDPLPPPHQVQHRPHVHSPNPHAPLAFPAAGDGPGTVARAAPGAAAGPPVASVPPSVRGGGPLPDASLLKPVIGRRLLPMPSPSRITASPAATPRSGDGASPPALPQAAFQAPEGRFGAATASTGPPPPPQTVLSAAAGGSGAMRVPVAVAAPGGRPRGPNQQQYIQGHGQGQGCGLTQLRSDLRVLLPHELLPGTAAAAAAAALEAAASGTVGGGSSGGGGAAGHGGSGVATPCSTLTAPSGAASNASTPSAAQNAGSAGGGVAG